MQRVCFRMELIPGREAEYRRRHDEIWPELVAELHSAGVRNYTLFRLDTTVIAYAECHPDAATAFGKVASTEVDARWSRWFRDVLVCDAEGGVTRAEATEVWHLE
ncbi:L-rhamnose mutarotase [Streptomyces sp. NPDC004752]